MDQDIGILAARVNTALIRKKPPEEINEKWSNIRSNLPYGYAPDLVGPMTDLQMMLHSGLTDWSAVSSVIDHIYEVLKPFGLGTKAEYTSRHEYARETDSINKEIQAMKRRISEQQDRLSNSQQQHNVFMDTLKTEAAKEVEKLNANFSEIEAAHEKVLKQVKEISENKTMAEMILQRLGTWEQSLGSAHGGTQHKKIANDLRLYASICMFMGITMLAVLLYREGTLDYATLPYKLAVSFLFLIPAFYLAKESNKHRDMEFTLFMRGLELETFQPFIAPLEGEFKNRVIEKHTNSFFGQSNIHRREKKNGEIHLIESLINSAKDTIEAATKRGDKEAVVKSDNPDTSFRV